MDKKIYLNTQVAFAVLSVEEEVEFQRLVEAAKAEKRGEAERVRESYIDERSKEIASKRSIPKEEARRTVVAAIAEKAELYPDFMLKLDKHGEVAVADVLANMKTYDGATLADPLEPDYNGGRNVAKLYANKGKPVIYSFAHGGKTYFLHTDKPRSCEEDEPPEWMREVPPVEAYEDGHHNDSRETNAEITARLAKLPPMEYDRVRKEEAKQLGIRVATLDCEVTKARGDERENNARGTAVEFEAIDPWSESVDGATLLDELAATFKHYLVLPQSAEAILALWVVHTYAIDAAHATPYLHVRSPLARCGKSKLLDLLEALVYRHLKFSNATSAAIFRVIEAHHPTLLIDEADTYIKDNEDLRGILNDGYRPGGKVLRAVPSGDDFEPRFFSVWGAKAIAGIGRLPPTVEDRSITISMKRKTKSETVERLRWRTIRDALLPLRRRITRWVKDNATALHAADPDTPEELNDRTAEVCEILFAIADAVGGRWPKHARKVATALSGVSDTDAELKGIQLLADLRQLFEERNTDRLSSEEIAKALVEMEDRPWAEYRKGQPITKNGVAKLLKPFDIKPERLRFSDGRAGYSGYELSWFKDAFSRYLRNSVNSTSTTQQTSWGAASSDFSNLNSVEVEKPSKTAADNSCCDVEVENRENGARATNGKKSGEVVEGLEGDIEGINSPTPSDGREINIVDGSV